jgi:hypothetical protein
MPEFTIGDDHRREMHVVLALSNVVNLPRHIHDEGFSALVQFACLESWLVNIRLLVEFLVRRRAQSDIH